MLDDSVVFVHRDITDVDASSTENYSEDLVMSMGCTLYESRDIPRGSCVGEQLVGMGTCCESAF